jgi:hypothetical protein
MAAREDIWRLGKSVGGMGFGGEILLGETNVCFISCPIKHQYHDRFRSCMPRGVLRTDHSLKTRILLAIISAFLSLRSKLL